MTGLFDLPIKNNIIADKAVISKASKARSPVVSIKGTKNLAQKIATMKDNIEKYLGDKRNLYLCITDEAQLISYIDDCIANNIVAIDTETTGLDPLSCDIVGFSLFTPGNKACYIPINHKSYITGLITDHQLSVKIVREQLQRLIDNNVKTVWFNAKFDVRVLKNTVGVIFIPYFDTYIASRLLNENEPVGDRGLKALHKKYVLGGEQDAFSYGELFEDIQFDLVPIDTGYLYAARDAQITYEFYEFQLPYLTIGTEECIEQELEGVSNVFWNIEMPIVNAVADMEDLGVKFDFTVQQQLSERYHILQNDAEHKFYSILNDYTDNEYSISSPQQLVKLFYDELKLLKPQVDRFTGKVKRPVDEETLSAIDHPLAIAILEYRGYAKLISTYIDKMAECARRDGRVHGEFNQLGTDTGRFSSSNPNLQNIPSKNAEIRTMFTASDGYIMLSSDYSAQEPRLTACMSGDERMIYEYNNGIDPYVSIASIAYDVPYDECKEFHADGTVNKEGKKRRKAAKKVMLGITYGAGIATVAEGLGVPEEKAKEINKRVFDAYTRLLPFKEESENMAYTKGYVTTFWGRKRRLPDFSLPMYEFYYSKTNEPVSQEVASKYIKMINHCSGYKKPVFQKINLDGVYVIDNTKKISQAERQCVNSRIQGSAADQTKIAMRLIVNNKRLNELGFRLLLQVHDELIGECPEESVEECSRLFSDCMVEAAKDLPIKTVCDVEAMRSWSM